MSIQTTRPRGWRGRSGGIHLSRPQKSTTPTTKQQEETKHAFATKVAETLERARRTDSQRRAKAFRAAIAKLVLRIAANSGLAGVR